MKSLIVTALIVLTTAAAAQAGGMTSSGGENFDIGYESAWFLGTEPVSYCIQIAPGESITKAQVTSDFESALTTWQKYYLERASYLHDEERELNFNFVQVDCTSTTRLRLLIGVDSEQIREDKKRFVSPWGFVKRTEYDFNKGLGRGYIWFAPNSAEKKHFPQWSTPNVFHGALLHEVGHIYGCGHIEHTIMEADLIPKFQTAASDDPNWAKYGEMYMTSIDHHYILLFNQNAQINLEGHIHPNAEESKKIFEDVTGQPAQGEARARIKIKNGKLELTLFDEKQSYSIDILLVDRTPFSLGGQIFYAVKANKGYSTGTSGYIYHNKVESPRGETIRVQVTINANESGWPVAIRYEDSNGQRQDLFGSDLWATAGLPR